MPTISPHFEPYYSDPQVTLFHGDAEDILPTLGQFDLAVIDPPYAETSLDWDQWVPGLPSLVAEHAHAMWCFGSMRMFLERGDEFTSWKFSQDIVWEKHNGSNLANDRFNRVHENALFWYQGSWSDVYAVVPTTASAVKRTVRKKARPAQWIGATGANTYTSTDGGPLLMASVIFARSMHGRAVNETEKPVELLEPLIEYACPPGGTILDATAGAGSTGVAAKAIGRKAVLIEKRESQCYEAAKRLSQDTLFGGVA